MMVGRVNNPLCSPNIGEEGGNIYNAPKIKYKWKNFIAATEENGGLWKYIWIEIGLLPKSPLAAAAETLNPFVKFPLPALATRHLDLSSFQAFKDVVLPFVTHRIGLVRPKMGKPESRPGSVSKTCFPSLLGFLGVF